MLVFDDLSELNKPLQLTRVDLEEALEVLNVVHEAVRDLVDILILEYGEEKVKNSLLPGQGEHVKNDHPLLTCDGNGRDERSSVQEVNAQNLLRLEVDPNSFELHQGRDKDVGLRQLYPEIL